MNAISLSDAQCVTLIGMAGAGKSTIGRKLAERLGWAQVDTDFLIEAAYGVRLQTVADALSKEEFLDMEGAVIRTLRVRRAVLSTGGSVIYRAEAMRHLKAMGPVVYLDVRLPVILERISRKPDRGLAIAPGQTVEDLFREREALYRQWADVAVPTEGFTVAQSAEAVWRALGLPEDAARPQAEQD